MNSSVVSFETGYHYMLYHNTKVAGGYGLTRNVRKAVDVAMALGGGKATRSFFPDYSPWFLKDSSG